jgi:hypothetical protein
MEEEALAGRSLRRRSDWAEQSSGKVKNANKHDGITRSLNIWNSPPARKELLP